MSLKGRSIVSLEGLSSAEIERILQLAAQMKNIVEYYRTGAAPQGHTYRWLTNEGMDTFIRRNAREIRPLLQGL